MNFQSNQNQLRVGVVIEETWAFFKEIYSDLHEHYEVTLFERQSSDIPVFNTRLNRYLFDRGLQNFLRENEIVFFEWASEILAAATQMPKTCKIISRLHRYELYRWADKINWEAVDCLIVVTEGKKREFVSLYPEMQDRVVVIPEAVSLERFKPFEKPFAGDIGTLCTLIPRKRVYELILAFRELLTENPKLHLHIGGPEHHFFAEYSHALYDLVERTNLSTNVTFYGRVSEPEKWYQNLDIFVSNSYSEGLQVALLEAMASGIYSLSHAWVGADELLPKENLFLSERELIECIQTYLNLSAEERITSKYRMLDLVKQESNIQDTIILIRKLIEDIANLKQPVDFDTN